jgi:hypothetical protein
MGSTSSDSSGQKMGSYIPASASKRELGSGLSAISLVPSTQTDEFPIVSSGVKHTFNHWGRCLFLLHLRGLLRCKYRLGGLAWYPKLR